MAFVNSHYDLITDIAKTENTEKSGISSSEHNSSNNNKEIDQTIKEIRIDEDIHTDVEHCHSNSDIFPEEDTQSTQCETSSGDFMETISSDEVIQTDMGRYSYDSTMQGNRRYIDQRLYEDIECKVCEEVPNDVDGLSYFVVPMRSNLRHCKGGRPWGNVLNTKSTKWTKGPRLLTDCKGSYHCTNPSCDNIEDFGINVADFVVGPNKDVLCKICRHEASPIRCDARMYFEKDNENKKIYVKHWGIHTCRRLSSKTENTRKQIETVMSTGTLLTAQGVIRQEVGRSLETTHNFEESVNVAASFTDKNLMNNIRKKIRTTNHPHGQSFIAVKHIQESYSIQDPFLIFDMDDGQGQGKQNFLSKNIDHCLITDFEC